MFCILLIQKYLLTVNLCNIHIYFIDYDNGESEFLVKVVCKKKKNRIKKTLMISQPLLYSVGIICYALASCLFAVIL